MQTNNTVLSIAEVKRNFSKIVDEVIYHRKRFLIGRRGKAMVGLVPAGEMPKMAGSSQSGFLGLIGLWGDVEKSKFEKTIKDIYKQRGQDIQRPVSDLDD